ncbi:MAG: PspC domain-containing protein [Bacteroidaceae bacterium]|nr:PspC domain-containing protein [Bacteroidaceae bacterium]
MADKKLVRSANKMVAGVCGGLAEYFGMDATIVRIIYLLATIFTAFAGVLIYIILMIVMPAQK